MRVQLSERMAVSDWQTSESQSGGHTVADMRIFDFPKELCDSRLKPDLFSNLFLLHEPMQ